MDDVELALFERQVEALEAIAAHLEMLARDARHKADMEEMQRQQHQSVPRFDPSGEVNGK